MVPNIFEQRVLFLMKLTMTKSASKAHDTVSLHPRLRVMQLAVPHPLFSSGLFSIRVKYLQTCAVQNLLSDQFEVGNQLLRD